MLCQSDVGEHADVRVDRLSCASSLHLSKTVAADDVDGAIVKFDAGAVHGAALQDAAWLAEAFGQVCANAPVAVVCWVVICNPCLLKLWRQGSKRAVAGVDNCPQILLAKFSLAF
jgi:hypothetical protein